AGSEPSGGAGRRKLDYSRFRADAEHFYRRHRFGVAGGFGAYSVRSRPGFLLAFLAGKSSPQVSHAVRGADRARGSIGRAGGVDLLQFRCAGELSEAALPGSSAAVASVFVRLWRAA